MPKAETDNTSSRRKFLGHLATGTAAIAVAASASSIIQAAPIAAPHSDAELIALCAQHDQIQAQCDALWGAHPDDAPDWLDDALGALDDDQHNIGTDILFGPGITTLAGAIAVAKLIAEYRDDWVNDPSDRNQEWVSMLVRGLVGLEDKV